ncbi:TPA: hypothetical protein KSK42_003173 [Clostridioides difficile]|nr:hypothetical protein [Clostridioides difficile]
MLVVVPLSLLIIIFLLVINVISESNLDICMSEKDYYLKKELVLSNKENL